MRICLLCTDVDIPVMGNEGCSVKIRQFGDTLIEQGHDVTILCSWVGDGEGAHTAAQVRHLAATDLDAAAWSALECDPAVLEANLERDLRSLFVNSWLRTQGPGLFGDQPPDLVYERYALFGYAGAQWARSLGAAHVLELNGPLCREQEGYDKFPLLRTAEILEGEILRAAGTVIAVSSWLGEFAREHGVPTERIEVMPNGVAPHFAAEFSGSAARARLGLDGSRVIGYLGSFQPWHDLDGLLDALRRIHRADPGTRLLLVGDGPDRERVAERVAQLSLSDSVVMTGHIRPEDVPEHVAAMDVAVAPYSPRADFYFSPLKLFECMAVGRPNVAARIGQIEEIVDDGEDGLLYAAGDSEDLADVLAGVLAEPDRRERIGAAGRRKILSEHTMAANAQRVIRLAERLSRSAP